MVAFLGAEFGLQRWMGSYQIRCEFEFRPEGRQSNGGRERSIFNGIPHWPRVPLAIRQRLVETSAHSMAASAFIRGRDWVA